MRTSIHLLTAACLASSSFLFLSQTVSADTTVTHNEKTVTETTDVSGMSSKVEAPKLPAGITAKELNSEKAIEKSLKGVAEYSLSTTGFDNIVSYLADQDKDRVKKSTDKSLNNIDGNKNKALVDAINGLNAAWKAKYNTKFDVDFKKAYTSDFVQIQTGEVSDPNQLVGKWPVSNGMMPAEGKMTSNDAAEAKKTYGGQVNLEKGRDVAIAHIVASHGMPAVTASMIHEVASGWHFDIPNSTSAQSLYDNLTANLNHLKSHPEMLPADVNDGNRMVTHAVIAALYDINLDKLPAGTASEK